MYFRSSWCSQNVPFMEAVAFTLPSFPELQYTSSILPCLVHKNHRVCHVHFHDEDRASKSYLKKNAVPSLFLPVPTVDGRENVSDHKHCTIVAESNAPTPELNGVDRTTCNMSNKSKRGEALVWESFCEAATSVATSIDCCKTSVQVTHGMVRDRSIILLEVLVPGPRDKHEID
ncbi:hypothetical protein Trydic_g10074, partial [Trypoxylus dichotomus]